MEYSLLNAFRRLFQRQPYFHRKSNLGDFVAMHLYEDIYTLARSNKFRERVASGLSVLNIENKRHGIKARRGDGSFGETVPHSNSIDDRGYVVRRGPIATIEIGIEVKILMKAMIKQIDRVASDLRGQTEHFRSRGDRPICVGVVGINHAPFCTTYEADREFPTDGKKYKHPIQEAATAEARLIQYAAPAFDEFIILRFKASNVAPYSFEWVDEAATRSDYGAALVRVSRLYEQRV